MSTRLHGNGIWRRTGRHFRAPASLRELAAKVGSADPTATVPRGALAGVSSERLAEAGWGLVVTSPFPTEILDALTPLLDLRKAQAGPLYQELAYRPGDDWRRFLGRRCAAVAPVDPRKVPYYLLIVGCPTAIPFEFQYGLGIAYAVGRLWLGTHASPTEPPTRDELAAYRRYALTVVAADAGEVVRPRRVAVFGADYPGDETTKLTRRHLVEPLTRSLAERSADGAVSERWRVDSVVGSDATKERLGTLLRQPSHALLWTAGHGLVLAAADPEQQSDQGALLCADWPGPKGWKGRVPATAYYGSRDLATSDDLSGLVACHFACFSAGTPRHDAFGSPLGRPERQLARQPFIAPLARRQLALGALAVVGHVDAMWIHGFVLEGTQIEAFESLSVALLEGRRIGAALDGFGQRYAALAAALAEEPRRSEGPRESPAEPLDLEAMTTLRIAYHDARTYVLLGDPAVRLAVTEGRP